MGLSSAGIGSGLDVKSLVASLVAAEIEPRQKNHDNKLASINTRISAVGQLKSSLTNLQGVLSNLSNLSQLYKLKGQSSDESSLTANISSKATAGTYQIQVQSLAQSHSVASNSFSTTAAGGTLNICFGTYGNQNTVFTPNNTSGIPDLQVTINPGDSLEAIQTAINSSNSGVTANVIQCKYLA
jgi:flagellar hook-associated protein 2